MILTTLPTTNVRTARRGDGGLHPGTPSQVTLSAGAGQSAIAGAAVAIAPAVLVRDQLDRPVAGVPMQFVVVGGSSASQVTVDAFTRANENPLAGTWSKAGGAATNLQLLNNTIQGVTASGEGLMYSTAATWPADQYSECQLLVGDPGGGGPAVRMAAGAESAYIAQTTVGLVGLYKFVAGVFTVLQQVGTTVASTDTLRLEARGSTLRMYKNGVQLGTDVLDASLSTGAPGLDLFSNTTFTITRWAAGVPPTTSGTVTPDTPVVTDASGLATVTAWTLGTVPGVNTLTVTSAGLVGSPVSVTATGTGGAGVATQIALNAGNNQSAVAGTNVATPPSVIVRDAGGAPVAGVLVTFAVATGGGSVTGPSQNTNASGIATVGSWTLGAAAGTNTLTASSAGLTGSPVTVTATGTTPVTFDFYVSPTGGTGTGAIGDPWSLSYALGGAGGAITPGKIIALRAGTYSGTFTNTVNGTVANPVIFRQYPGERATVSGNLLVFGSYTWFWGFEVISPTPSVSQVNAIQSRSVGAKYIHVVVHDAAGIGITLFDDVDAKPDQEAYGCLVYNNGNANIAGGATQPWDHGFYATNTSGYRKLRNNIVFNNTDFGMQIYPTVTNATIDGNIIFDNGCTSTPAYIGNPIDLLVGGNAITTPTVITNNAIYRVHPGNGSAVDVGYYFSPLHTGSVTFTGNYVYGLTEIRDWVTATITGNTVYGLGTYSEPGGAGIWTARGNLAGHTYATNTWYGDPAATNFAYGAAGQTVGTPRTYAQWLTATGLVNPGTFVSGTSPNYVTVRPSEFEPGRGHVAVFNWTGATSLAVDLSTILTVGQTFAVKSAFDFYGTAIVTGVYGGGTVTVPMTGLPLPPTPTNPQETTPTNPGTTFHAFVVLAQGAE